MGLFSRRRDSEVDDLDSPYSQDGQEAAGGAWQGQAEPAAQPLEMTEQAQPRQSVPPKHQPVEYYGFDHVAQLMQSLPLSENRDLVVRVFKKTLESVNISLDLVVEDAERRVSEITEQISQVKQIITDLQQEVNTRRKEATDLEAQLMEVAKVKDLLLLAKNAEGQSGGASDGTGGETDGKTRGTIPPAKVVFGPRDSKSPELNSTKK